VTVTVMFLAVLAVVAQTHTIMRSYI